MTIDQFTGSVRIIFGGGVMRGEHNGTTSPILSKVAQQLEDHLGIASIELAGGLVGQQDRTITCNSPGYPDPLGFTTG